jgi:lipopolysaccharide export system protein LptC
MISRGATRRGTAIFASDFGLKFEGRSGAIRNEKLGMSRLVAAPAIERQKMHAFTAMGRTRSERMFRRAARHSRVIRFLRVGIPGGIFLALGLIVVAAYFNPLQKVANASIDQGKLALSGSKIAMQHPRLSGYTNESLPYEVSAQVASQDLANPGVIELTELRGTLKTKDQGMLEITARTGSYDIKADMLRLSDNILLQLDNGYEARLHEATIDVKKGTIVSEHRIETKFPNGTLGANHLDVSENGAVVLFSQGVQTFLVLDPTPATAAATSSQQ